MINKLLHLTAPLPNQANHYNIGGRKTGHHAHQHTFTYTGTRHKAKALAAACSFGLNFLLRKLALFS